MDPEGLQAQVPQGAEGLNPRAFISALKSGQASDEVSLRRAVSAVFLSLFNYWALKHYLKDDEDNSRLVTSRFPSIAGTSTRRLIHYSFVEP